MSIFKESLPRYIKDQFSVREGVIRMGNNGADGNTDTNSGGGRFSKGYANTEEFGNINIQKGAFYTNTINKSCTIRMASLVDLQTDTILDKEGVNGRIEKDFGGPGMALTYILEGGTIIKGVKDNKVTVNDEGETVRRLSVNQKPVMRRGFPTQKWNLGGTYGDPIIRADAKDGFGIVPMPGITDIDIKTKSAYGSLREAKVKFECHNLRQLEILELLYMRPGYPVLLEWAWSSYVGNDGKITSAPQWISEAPEFWDASKVSQEGLASNIIKKRQETGGNYDGILGFCKNFSYTARPDGGFTCSTELMAVGETINSIKGKMVTEVRDGDKFDIPKIQHLLNSFVDGIIGLAGGDDSSNTDTQNFETEAANQSYLNKMADLTGGSTTTLAAKDEDAQKNLTDLKKAFNIKKSSEASQSYPPNSIGVSASDEGTQFIIDQMVSKGWTSQNGYAKQKGMQKYSTDSPPKKVASTTQEYNTDYDSAHLAYQQVVGTGTNATKDQTTLVQTWQADRNQYWDEAVATSSKEVSQAATDKVLNNSDYSNILKPGVHLIGPRHDSTSKAKFQGKMGFIRLDSFCKMLNVLVIPENTKGGGRILAFQTNHFSTHNSKFDSYKFNAYNEKFFKLFEENVDLDISVDPFICLFPHQVVSMEEGSYSENIEFYRPVLDVSGYNNSMAIEPSDFYGTTGITWPLKSEDITRDVREKAKKSVGNIYLNLDMLHKQCRKLQSQTKNEHFSLGKFMFNVLEEVNKATGGNHKLALVNNHEFPNIINIVDINGETAHKSYDDVHQIKVQSTDSVVRQFSFNTEIPSAMSATIAVAAQNPNNANALDEVTFAALNRGIRNRLYRPSGPNTPQYSKKEKEKKKELLNKQIEELGQKLASIKYYNRAIKKRTAQKDDDQRQERTDNYRSTLIRVQTLTDIIAQKDDNGLPTKSPPSSTPIPIKVDLTFDGIGGLVIGQLFRINTSRLPKHYRGKNILFLIKSEAQKIGKNGDWTTKIQGQMQLFDTTPTKSAYGKEMADFLQKALRAEEKKADKKKKDLDANKSTSAPPSAARQAAAKAAEDKFNELVSERKRLVIHTFKQLRVFVGMQHTICHDCFEGKIKSNHSSVQGKWKKNFFDGDDWKYASFFKKLADTAPFTWSETKSLYSLGFGYTANSKSSLRFLFKTAGSADSFKTQNNAQDLNAVIDKQISSNGDEDSLGLIIDYLDKNNKKDKRKTSGFSDIAKVEATVDGETVNHGKYTPASITSIIDAEFPGGCDHEKLEYYMYDADPVLKR